MGKQTFGESIIEGLSELSESLEKKEKLSERFTVNRVVLNLAPTTYEPSLVKKTRNILRASQAVFAQFLGVSAKTVQAWESGHHSPNVMACRFMDEIRQDPDYWRKRIEAVAVNKLTRPAKVLSSK